MLKNEGDKLKKVVVCSPGREYFNVANLESHNITQLSDPKEARAQHDRLKEVMSKAGAEIIDIPEFPGHPNSVFTMDTAISTPQGYIQMRMGLDTRRGEERWIAERLEELEEPCAGKIEPPATVEGGDVILAGTVAFIGNSSRTNQEGIDQISQLLSRMGYEIRTTAVPEPYLHIGGAMTMVGPDRILCCRGVFPESFFNGFEVIQVSGANFISGNVIYLGDNQVIANYKNEETIQKLEEKGIIVHPLDLSEFVKGTGGPSCLIMALERE